MARSVVASVVLFATLAGTAAAPVPKGQRVPPWHPTTVGDRWVTGIDDREYTDIVTAVEQTSGGTLVTVDRMVDGRVQTTSKILVAAHGVFCLDAGGDKYDPPDLLLRLPPTPGDKWKTETVRLGTRVISTRIARELEWVEVPAGRFKAVRVDKESTYIYPESRATYKTTSWYAPGVGRVKSEGVGGAVFVLKSYKPTG